jgi:two-component system NarL family sensor kinase
VLVLAAIVVTAAAGVVDARVSDAERDAAWMAPGLLTAIVGAPIMGAAAVLLWLRPHHRVGLWLALLGVTWTVDGLAASWAAYALPDGLPGLDLAFWVYVRLGSVLVPLLIVVLVIYPDGRLPRGAARVLAVTAVATSALLPTGLMVTPDRFLFDGTGVSGVDTEAFALPIGQGAADVLRVVGQVGMSVGMLCALVTLLLRHRAADEEQRRSLKWLLWGGLLCLVTVIVLGVLGPGEAGSAALGLAVVTVSASIVIGIGRPHAVDVDALVARTLTLALVAGTLVALDVAVLALVESRLGDRTDEQDARLLVLLLVLLLYGPVRTLVADVVRRLLLGRRGDRYAVVSSFARTLETAGSVQEQLPALARAVASAFNVPWVRVEVVTPGGDLLAADHGDPQARARTVEMSYQGERIGRLVLPQHGLRALMSARDQDLLLDLVRQAALAVRTGILAEELQLSRERLVLSREDDRRRIRRDLHDGLGPVLGGVALRLQAAGNVVAHDPARARELVAQSRAEIQEALDDVRRLVHGLRPPALDDLGLAAAVEQQAMRVRDQLDVEVRTEGVAGLPAALEVAAYRIVSESLTNVVRHAAAQHCTITLTPVPADDPRGLEIAVTDDGRGIPDDVAAGVGLLSVRERAEELGGHAEVVCPPEGGTRMRAWLPLGRADLDPALPAGSTHTSVPAPQE